MSSALITVLLPVYNGAADVEQAVMSILGQTHTDFELLIINDGSKDNSAEILEGLCDSRIRLIHQENMGLAATLNRGIDLANGCYIARQDQDDLSLPTRLEKQLTYMELNPDCALLGTRAEIWVGNTRSDRAHDHPVEPGGICFDLLFDNPFVHSSMMMRRDAVKAMGGYSVDPLRQPPEDYELWSRMARCYGVANLPERLLVYREVPQSMSRVTGNRFLDKIVTISAENLAHAIGVEQPDSVCFDIAAIEHSAFHRLSAQPNIKQMCDVVTLAGNNIANRTHTPQVVQLAKSRAVTLRYKFLMYRARLLWIKPLLRGMRFLASKLYSR